MNTLTRGVKNAFRNTIRTFSIVIILGLSIGLALAMLIARQAVEAKIATVKSSIGNVVTISPAGFRGFNGAGNPLTDSQLTTVKNLPHVSSITESLTDQLDSTNTNLQSAVTAGSLGKRFSGNANFNGGGRFGSGGDATTTFTPPIQVVGSTDAAQLSSDLGGGTLKLTSGKTFDPTVDADVALVGTTLASKNNLTVGSTFQAYGATITVDGIFDAGNTFSNAVLVMPLPTVQRLSGQAGDVTSAVVSVDSISNVSSVTKAISATLGSAADVTSEQDSSAQALAPLQNIASISLYSLIGALVAGAAIILLTMLMIVRERRREIGVLKAIGSTNTNVMLQFMTESITLTLLGMVVGVIIGFFASNPLTQLLVTSSSTTATTSAGPGRGFGQAGVQVVRFLGQSGANLRNIQATVGWQILLYGVGAAIIIAIIGSAVPALLISRIRPAEVMRAE